MRAGPPAAGPWPERPATQREVDQLRARVEQIDASGTRGVAQLAAQLADLIKDMDRLERRADDHDKVHEQARRDRAAGRRWLAGTAIAIIMMLIALLALVAQLHGGR